MSMKNSDKKKEARIKFKELRERTLLLNEKLILTQVKNFLDNLITVQKSKYVIGIYWPLAGEVDLRSLSQDKSLSLALPACKTKGKLSYHKWTSKPLIRDLFGIPAPLSEPPLKPKEIKLLLVPALAIDPNGIRLGYGSGSFDQLRKEKDWRAIQSLAIVPKACITSEQLPRDHWDIPFDGWINENGSFFIKSINK